jgi:hypothetical protein
MELDYCYQSIPHNCELISMARERPMFGEFLELYGFREISFEEMRFRAGDEDFAVYLEEAKGVRESVPGIETRRIVLGQGREELVEELSKHRRGFDQVVRAVRGGDILGVSMCSTSGVPINFHPPYSVKMIARQLNELDASSIESPHFQPLRDIYATSASLDEGILTICL